MKTLLPSRLCRQTKCGGHELLLCAPQRVRGACRGWPFVCQRHVRLEQESCSSSKSKMETFCFDHGRKMPVLHDFLGGPGWLVCHRKWDYISFGSYPRLLCPRDQGSHSSDSWHNSSEWKVVNESLRLVRIFLFLVISSIWDSLFSMNNS